MIENPAPRLPEISTRNVADIELPRELLPLYDLAYNLWWTWNPRAPELFSAIDSRAWSHYRNPVQLLINVEPRQWEPLLENDTFLSACHAAVRELEAYLDPGAATWFRSRFPTHDGAPIAYFSMEYGLDQCLPIYSGGLGVLSGDHLKSASDLDVPLVAVGLLYRTGYFRQTVDGDGRQQHIYPTVDFERLPVRPVSDTTGRDVLISVPFPDREVAAKVWLARVGRVPLLLLDTDIQENDPADRPITGTLYVQGRPMRLAQEILLGIGGVRALAAVGIEPATWHVNEGHSALLQLERMATLVAAGVSDVDQALEVVRQTTVFTTHTPVPAGNECFDHALAKSYLTGWPERLGTSWKKVSSLGSPPGASDQADLSLTALALRSSRFANGVSRLHGSVSRSMWRPLFGAATDEDVPIDHITNGVHLPTWLGREMRSLFRRHLGPEWQASLREADSSARLLDISDRQLWEAHRTQKRRLGRFVRSRVREQLARHGRSPEELREVDGFFLDDTLTIGFARRFATYKRAKLIFHDPHELRRLVESIDQPVQILFAGKAHPADRPGQELIRHIFQLSQSSPFRGRVIYLEDYDMQVGRMLVQGVDVWLNTPRRPLEASGTSGQKAAANGVLNCSVLDGWWPEAFDGTNGWVIGAEDPAGDDEQKTDLEDAQALYRVLGDEIVPIFYDRDTDGRPARWIEMMRRSIATVAPVFSADRMVRDYATKAYFPNEPAALAKS